MSEFVAGADGCRSGWVVVAFPAGSPDRATVSLVERIADLTRTRARPFDRLLIDMPIGLPDAAERGGRACDKAARALLGWPRSASVFSPPARPTLAAADYADALARNRATAPDAPGLSKESFHLFPRIREVDAWITPERQSWVGEGHPEVSFARMNREQSGGGSLRPGKRTSEGRQLRRDLLIGAGFLPDEWTKPKGAAWDDVFDAAALAWSAGCWLEQVGIVLPDGTAQRDARGVQMTVRA